MPFNPIDYPMISRDPRHLPMHTAWIGHVPFAFAIMQMLRPEVLVELGAYQGSSYCAFCQAVAELKLPTQCFAIDTWQGDSQTGMYDEQVLRELRAHHDPLYSGFSKLLRVDFDSAAPHFEDGSIDLLHIDGLHTYEAVRHDYDTWRPKMSDFGVMLFHDTDVRGRNFGVWKLWDEVSGELPHFEFKHSHGLGVLAVGKRVPPAVLDFLATATAQPEAIRNFFNAQGDRVLSLILLLRVCEHLDLQQIFLQNWQQRVGLPQVDQPIVARENLLEAARRVERQLLDLAKRDQLPRTARPGNSAPGRADDVLF